MQFLSTVTQLAELVERLHEKEAMKEMQNIQKHLTDMLDLISGKDIAGGTISKPPIVCLRPCADRHD